MSNHILLGSLTRREFRQRMESGELQTCIIPVAAIEQHLEHLAMEHDWRSVNVVAAQVAENLAPHVLVAQGVMAGVSEHHMNHPGTLTLRPGTFLAVVNDLIRSVAMAGFKNVVVLNGHGGTRYGVPFPVLARASFGTSGAVTVGSTNPVAITGTKRSRWYEKRKRS